MLLPLLLGLLAALVLLLWLSPAAVPARHGRDDHDPRGGRPDSGHPVPDADPAELDPAELDPAELDPADLDPADRRLRSVREAVSTVLSRRGGSAGRRTRAMELQVLDGLAATLEAGLPVARGVQLAVTDAEPDLRPTSVAAWSALGRVAAEGQQLGPAWERLARHTRSPTLVSVARAWRVADQTGAPLASALRVSAHAARERHRLERAVEVAVAGPRATVTVLTLLPIAGVGLAAVLGVPPTQLYGDPVAQAAVGSGAVLLLLGQVWVRRLVARVIRGTT